MELRFVVHVFLPYLLTHKCYHSLPYHITSWMSHDDLFITSSDFVWSPLSSYHGTIVFFVLLFAVRAHICQDPLPRYCLIYVSSFYYCLRLVCARLL